MLDAKVQRMESASRDAGWATSVKADREFTAVISEMPGVRMEVWFCNGKWSVDDGHRSRIIRSDNTVALLRNAGAARKILDPLQDDPVPVELKRSAARGSLPPDRQWRSLPWADDASLADINRHLQGPLSLLWRCANGRLHERIPPEGSVRAAVVQRPSGPEPCLLWAEDDGVWSVVLRRLLRCEPPCNSL
jgi:hypothetical protein